MSFFRVLQLTDQALWEPGTLLAPAPQELWPSSEQYQPVSALATLVGGGAKATDELPVVTPGGIDPSSGKVARTRRDYTGIVRRIGAKESDLHLGDVLVPSIGTGPAVLVSRSHRGIAFASSFHVLRSEDRTLSGWLWACLSSESGIRVRRSAIGATVPSLSPGTLLALPIPLPASSNYMLRLEAVAEEASQIDEIGIGGSWWRMTNMPLDGRWHPRVFMREPELLDRGSPLREFAQVFVGRRPVEAHEDPRPGLLPVRQGSNLGSRRVSLWAKAGSAPEILPGDVLLSEFNSHGKIVMATAISLAGSGLLVVRPNHAEQGRALAACLSSEAAQALRADLVEGAHIRRLTPASLREFPVELGRGEDAVSQRETIDSESLDARLERLLWG